MLSAADLPEFVQLLGDGCGGDERPQSGAYPNHAVKIGVGVAERDGAVEPREVREQVPNRVDRLWCGFVDGEDQK